MCHQQQLLLHSQFLVLAHVASLYQLLPLVPFRQIKKLVDKAKKIINGNISFHDNSSTTHLLLILLAIIINNAVMLVVVYRAATV